MARELEDWITAFLDYTEHMEAPRFMRTWAAISAIASCLRRKVWIDQDQFVWTPGLYIVFVGPPGVITKSTTTDLSSNLLREIPGIRFGPNNITWQALATAFASASESFEYPLGSGEWNPMAPITLVSRELGSLLNPKDQDLVNLFIELYDGAKVYEKVTKMSGTDTVGYPWINLLGATTPSWIAENVPRAALAGGLVSRIIFLYGDKKEKFVPYPAEVIRSEAAHKIVRRSLVHDLEHIAANLVGPYKLTKAAVEWGSKWYIDLWNKAEAYYDDDKLMGYIARKQTHLHKVAMILSASRKDELSVEVEDLQLAEQLLLSVEGTLDKVFSRIGRSEESLQVDRFISVITRRGRVPYEEAYRLVHAYFPDFREFEGVCNGAIRSGQVRVVFGQDGKAFLVPANPPVLSADNPPPKQETAK